MAIAMDWGPAVNGLRMSLAIEEKTVVMTFENMREDREMYLPLGRIVGIRHPEFAHLGLTLKDGTHRQLQHVGGEGVAPGRLLPYIVPMMPGSVYTVRTLLQDWRVGSNLDRIEKDLSRGATLQASVVASESLHWEYVNCYGLQIFWSGRAVSNIIHSR